MKNNRYEMEEENLFEDIKEEESEEEFEEQMPMDGPLKCRIIRIGSYKVLPSNPCPYIAVNLWIDKISFQAPLLSDATKKVHIILYNEDILKVYLHFGKCLPVMFIYTTPKFGESVRNALHMIPNETPYFDPAKTDDKTQKLAFLVKSISEDQKRHIRHVFPGDEKIREIDQRSANKILLRSTPFSPENQDSDHPGVMTIKPNPDIEKKPHKKMKNNKYEIEEENLFEEIKEEKSEEEFEEQMPMDGPLKCRFITIGSYKVLPSNPCPYIAVNLWMDKISFQAPLLSDATKKVHIILYNEDILKVYLHFGKCLPVMFIYTTPKFGESVRNALHMIPNETPYFDPAKTDDKTQKLAFLVKSISEDQKRHIRHIFPGDEKVREIDQRAANEILLRSTPFSPQMSIIKAATKC